MTLVDFDGFDHYASSSPADIINRRASGWQWSQASGPPTWVTPGRGGFGSAIQLSGNCEVAGTLTTPLATGFFGIALRVVGAVIASYASYPVIEILDSHGLSGVVQLTLVLNMASNGIDIWRGASVTGTLLGSTPNNSFTWAAWSYLEVEAKIDPSAGTVTINNTGQQVVALTGLNTRNTINSQFDGVAFVAIGGSPTDIQIDDFYISDTTTGSGAFAFTGFAGDVRVATLNPIANAGTIQWTPLTSSNWVEVSEVHNDGDTSYNATTTVNDKDLFTFGALSSTISIVLAVQVTGSFRKDDAGTHTIQQHILSGSTEVTGATQTVPMTYVYFNDFWTTDPNTGIAWTTTGVNALVAGYELTT